LWLMIQYLPLSAYYHYIQVGYYINKIYNMYTYKNQYILCIYVMNI